MDFLSLIGVTVAFAAILGGNWLEGGHLEMLANGPALMIVLGGTIGGLLFGFGAQLGRGCTSGAALSGIESHVPQKDGAGRPIPFHRAAIRAEPAG